MKFCNKCNTLKELKEFHRSSRNSCGRQSSCKECANKTARDYNKKDHAKEVRNEYLTRNKQRIKTTAREYRRKNSKNINKYQKEYRKRTKNKCSKDYISKNKDKYSYYASKRREQIEFRQHQLGLMKKKYN